MIVLGLCQMSSDELRTWNANYDANTLVTRVRDLLERDDRLLGEVIQRSVMVKSAQVGPSDTQHAITKIDVLPNSTPAPQSKTVDYGSLLFVIEKISRDELLARLSKLAERQFTVGDQALISAGVGFSDRYEPSRSSYSDWPCRVFDISFGSAQLSYESLIHPIHKAYSSTFDAIQEFLELDKFNGSSDSRLGHIQVCVPNLNARIERMDLLDNRLRIFVGGPASPDSLKLAVSYKTDENSQNIEKELLQGEAAIDLSFFPRALTTFLISRAGFLADFHDENQHYSTGANPVLPKTREQASPALNWLSADGTSFPTGPVLLEAQPPSLDVRLDSLLNIPEKGIFEQDLVRVRDAASAEFPLSFLFVDIDHFKTVNDTYGHETGDEILKQVASALVAGCKQKGTVYRIGGEEIGILLPNYTLAEAEVLAERLRKQVSVVRNKQNPPAITVSIGVATFPEPVGEAGELYGAADRAMYAAKASGRNQVRTASTNTTAPKAVALTRQSLSVYMRTDDRMRRLDEEIARSSGQVFIQAEDASLHVFEKAQRLGVATVGELAELVRKYGDTAQNVARCMVPTTPVPAGQSLTFVLDVTTAQQGEHALRAYFQSLRYTTTAEEYIRDLLETLALLP
jgi:diguanylate cyclase (GGDEF)-like protein